MEDTEAKLKELVETNKFFYRLTSPSPYMVAQQQYLKRLLEKRGVDTTNVVEVAQALMQMGQNADLNMVRQICGHGRQNSNAGGQDAAGTGGSSGIN